MSNPKRGARARLVCVAMCLTVLATLGSSSPVSAHTDFAASIPTDGAIVEGPLSTVTVEFTNPAVESGEGFRLLTPEGTVRAPDSVDSSDGTSFTASFDPPLEAGVYGFRWEVQAGDAHPIQGSFRFTVEGPAATTTQVESTTLVESTTVVESTTTIPSSPTTTPAAAAAPVTSPSTTVPIDHSTMSMDEFLVEDRAPGQAVGRVARTMSMSSTVFAAGVLAALVWVIRGRSDEIERLVGWVRLAGLGLVAGGLVALAALDESRSTPLSEILTTKPGLAALLTMTGGVLVLFGFGPRSGTVVGPTRSLSAASAVDHDPAIRPGGGTPDPLAHDDGCRWAPDTTAALGLIGVALAIAAFSFDGHTVSRGPWVLHAAVDLVHVTAASVWVGGVFAMTSAAWMRRRRRGDTGLSAMVIRFSSVAAISLAALSVAGLVMAWLVLDAPGDLFSSEWGRVLLVKIGAVAIAAGLGGYNHFVLRPVLEARPGDADAAAHLRTALSIESAVMMAVIVITAVLVASST